jgi:hypothetical protein
MEVILFSYTSKAFVTKRIGPAKHQYRLSASYELRKVQSDVEPDLIQLTTTKRPDGR